MKNETVIGSVSGPCGLYDSIHYKGTALDGHNYFRFHFYINQKHQSEVTSTILESCYQVEEQFLKYARTLKQPIGKEKKMKTATKLKKAVDEVSGYPEITTEEAFAILHAKGGADFYAYRVSGLLRGLQRKGLGWDDRSGIKEPKNSLVTLTKAMQAPKGSEQQPYFGAIATAYGVKVAKWRVKNIY